MTYYVHQRGNTPQTYEKQQKSVIPGPLDKDEKGGGGVMRGVTGVTAMPVYLRLTFMGVSLCILIMAFRSLLRGRLSDKDSILWFTIALVCVVCGFFPRTLTWLSGLIGVDYPPALLFFAAIFVLMLIVFKCTVDISSLRDQTRELASQVSLLRWQLEQAGSPAGHTPAGENAAGPGAKAG
jgi:hypothetical protein